jgi:hypothetical protein
LEVEPSRAYLDYHRQRRDPVAVKNPGFSPGEILGHFYLREVPKEPTLLAVDGPGIDWFLILRVLAMDPKLRERDF